MRGFPRKPLQFMIWRESNSRPVLGTLSYWSGFRKDFFFTIAPEFLKFLWVFGFFNSFFPIRIFKVFMRKQLCSTHLLKGGVGV